MIRLLMSFFLAFSFSLADFKRIDITQDVVDSGIKIIDIRRLDEWRDTGVVNGSYTLTFFDINGNYDITDFTSKLDKILSNKDEEVAIICRSGMRSNRASKILTSLGYKIVDLKGGMNKAIANSVDIVEYNN